MSNYQKEQSQIQQRLSPIHSKGVNLSASPKRRPVKAKSSQKRLKKGEFLQSEVFAWFQKKGIVAGSVESFQNAYRENQRGKVRDGSNLDKMKLHISSSLMRKRLTVKQQPALRELH